MFASIRAVRGRRLLLWCQVLLGVALPSTLWSQTATAPPATAAPAISVGPQVEVEHGVVVSVSEPASRAGLEVLRDGGTAVDAAVATAFALAVTHPQAGNIGGGGFMLVHPGGGAEPVSFVYRETAPAASTKTMFELGEDRHTAKMAGTPGTVRGMELAHRRFGKLPWKRLVLPAVKLARDGFAVDRSLASSLNSIVKNSPRHEELRRVFSHPDKRPWEAGDKLVQPDLADSLEQIALKGPNAFYQGKIAELLVREMQQSGGLITRDDLAKYHAIERKPIHGTYRGYDVYGPPPPSSGGICLVQMLNVLETFNLRQRDRFAAETLHLMAEAMRRAYYERARHLGDPDFVEIPSHLTSKAFARELAATINPKRATPSVELSKDIKLVDESESTTHFSVIDATGMAVSNTYTLNFSYGNGIAVTGAGFLLNNEMDDFSAKPGVPNAFGLLGDEANAIEPGKRPLSSMTPTLVFKDGEPVLVTGGPGGSRIITSVLQVISNHVDFGMNIAEATAAPRIHHQWYPDQVEVEKGISPDTLALLRAMGHDVKASPWAIGRTQSITLEPGGFQGMTDYRWPGGSAEAAQ